MIPGHLEASIIVPALSESTADCFVLLLVPFVIGLLLEITVQSVVDKSEIQRFGISAVPVMGRKQSSLWRFP